MAAQSSDISRLETSDTSLHDSDRPESIDAVTENPAKRVPMLRVDTSDAVTQASRDVPSTAHPEIVTTAALDEPVELAKRIFDGDEQVITKDKAAAWLGSGDTINTETLHAYMSLYDFGNLNILAALRIVCKRLILKAESQQVDRILSAFAMRWGESNANHGFKAMGMYLLRLVVSH